uniref:CSON002688 protein n=1 Tax=Culicoides sonorensis TaxID=179676 RepID=A0A336LVT8_CULSO
MLQQQQQQQQQRQFTHQKEQQLDVHHNATINQVTMDVTSSPESDTVEIQVETTPSSVVQSPNQDDECETMVLDSSNTSNLINDNDTGSTTTEYVEILEDYTEPMFPETNIEVETSGSVVNDESPTTSTLQTIINEAAQSSLEQQQQPEKQSQVSLPAAQPSQTQQQQQPQIYYIYNSATTTKTNANNNTPTTTATIKQVIETHESNLKNSVQKKLNDDESAGPSSDDKTPTSDTKLFMCGVCKIILEKRYLANHMKKHLQQVNESHTCRICKDTFSRKMLLSVHISQKHSIFTKDYVCQICKLPYDENNNDLHGGCHWFCNICSKTFMTKASMVCHSRMRHNRNQGKFVCEYCGKHYWDKATLEYHARVHVGEEKVIPSVTNSNNGTNNGASTSSNNATTTTNITQDGQNNGPVLFLLQL